MTGILPHAKLDRFDLIILGDLPYMRRDQTETSMLFELTAERCCCRNAANNVRSLKRQFPQTIIFNGLQAFTETTGTGFGFSVDVLTLYRTGIETAMAFQNIITTFPSAYPPAWWVKLLRLCAAAHADDK